MKYIVRMRKVELKELIVEAEDYKKAVKKASKSSYIERAQTNGSFYTLESVVCTTEKKRSKKIK